MIHEMRAKAIAETRAEAETETCCKPEGSCRAFMVLSSRRELVREE